MNGAGSLDLNQLAQRLCGQLESRAATLKIERHAIGGAVVWDFGVQAQGGLEAGRVLAEICLAGLAEVGHLWLGPAGSEMLGLSVRTDHPALACIGSQYAGWRIDVDGFVAMGSGPMRMLAGKEPVLDQLQLKSEGDVAVGVLESSSLPSGAACAAIAADCGVDPSRLTLCVARTGSLAGTSQIVARSAETALHKLHELGFDLTSIRSVHGTAPLSPTTKDDFQALGWTNDAVLYGSRVALWIDADDASLEEIVPRLPSCASADHGRPFAEIFRRYEYDFYRVDPLLFSPAEVVMTSVRTGRVHRAGHMAWEIISGLGGP